MIDKQTLPFFSFIYSAIWYLTKPCDAYKFHDDVIKWKHFPCNWPFVRGMSPVNSLHKGQWHGALMFSLICVWINDWVNNREAGDLRRHRGHYDVIVMCGYGAHRNLRDILACQYYLILLSPIVFWFASRVIDCVTSDKYLHSISIAISGWIKWFDKRHKPYSSTKAYYVLYVMK